MSTTRDATASAEIDAEAQPAPCVRFDGVSLRRDGDGAVLRDLSFAIAPGSFHSLIGPAGSGKTSVLRLICLAETPSRGVVQIFGRDAAALRRPQRALMRRRIGAVFQPSAFIEHLSVRDNASLGPRVVGRKPADYESDVEELLAWTSLADKADAPPAVLSTAENQRLALARAVANRPDILLVDEPAAGLDAASAQRVLRLLRDLHRAGTTVILASRDADLAAR